MPAVRGGDAAGQVHEPLVVLLPEMPTEAARPPSVAPKLRADRPNCGICDLSAVSAKMGTMTDLWVERTGVRRYTGRSSRGAEVLVGNEDVEGVFTPGELMKIALAACSGMASDAPLQRRLGDDYSTTIRVSGPADREQERYPLLEERMELDLSGLSADEVARVLTVVERAIDQVCTVGRTLKSGTKVTFEVSDAGVS